MPATRREFLQTTALAAVGVALAGAAAQSLATPVSNQPASTAKGAGLFVLPSLPYAADALEPYFDAKTMQLHHDQHHGSYVTKLNEAIAQHPALAQYPIEKLLKNLSELPETVAPAVRNFGGGHYNHSLWWPMLALADRGGAEPQEDLRRALFKKFESLEGFKKAFTDAAAKHFGSGWAWLVVTQDKKLALQTTLNQDSPLSQGSTPILGVDVWEHAYYLKYQNRRTEYLQAFWNVVNWKHIQQRYQEAVDAS